MKNLREVMAILVYKLTGNLYWFEIKYRYRNKAGNVLFSWTRRVGRIRRAHLLSDRSRNAFCHKFLYFESKTAKPFLCNGDITNEVLCYLGWFRKLR